MRRAISTPARAVVVGLSLTCPFAALSEDDPGHAMPYDLAFAARSFNSYDRGAPSPDGSHVAFSVVARPERSPKGGHGTGHNLPNGTPYLMSGRGSTSWRSPRRRPRRSDLPTATPGAPWSPDGRRIAFYCDAGGPVRLWIHDLTLGRSRRLSEAPIKSCIFPGDEPRWGPDGRELFVRLRPPEVVATAGPPAAGRREDGPSVTVSAPAWRRRGGRSREGPTP